MIFSDLVGSTPCRPAWTLKTSARSSRPIRRASRRLGRFGGFVAKYMGDGVLIYFGYRRPTKTTQSEPCAQGWSWSLQ